MVSGYNQVRVSEEFRQLAELAEAMRHAGSGRLAVDRNALKLHDELLAGISVYRYLQDGHFLASPELLLCELRLLRANGHPRPPPEVLNLIAFVGHRSHLLDTLIRRFQNLLDFRDAIGAGEEMPNAPPASPRPQQPVHRRRSTPMPPTRG